MWHSVCSARQVQQIEHPIFIVHSYNVFHTYALCEFIQKLKKQKAIYTAVQYIQQRAKMPPAVVIIVCRPNKS